MHSRNVIGQWAVERVLNNRTYQVLDREMTFLNMLHVTARNDNRYIREVQQFAAPAGESYGSHGKLPRRGNCGNNIRRVPARANPDHCVATPSQRANQPFENAIESAIIRICGKE